MIILEQMFVTGRLSFFVVKKIIMIKIINTIEIFTG